MVRLYRVNKIQYDSRITETNHKLCQSGSVAESRLPHVTRREKKTYSGGFWPNVGGRGNLHGKLQNVWEKSPFVGDLYSKWLNKIKKLVFLRINTYICIFQAYHVLLNMSNQDVSRSVSVLLQFCQCSVVFVLSETPDRSLTGAYVSTITIS